MHIVITGAAGAIGSALARGLRARHASAWLTLADIDVPRAEALSAELGSSAAAAWDLSQPERVPEALAGVVGARGEVDALVNCAGLMEMKSLVGTGWALGERVLSVDLVSPLRLMGLVAPGMAERGRGTIVNVSSLAGVTPIRGCAYYGAAKAGLAMASEIARLELAPRGVRVITVYPGPVVSDLEKRARAQLPKGAVTRWIPTGHAEELAREVLRAWDSGAPRVVYPGLYELAHRAPRIAGWVTEWLSPEPNE